MHCADTARTDDGGEIGTRRLKRRDQCTAGVVARSEESDAALASLQRRSVKRDDPFEHRLIGLF